MGKWTDKAKDKAKQYKDDVLNKDVEHGEEETLKGKAKKVRDKTKNFATYAKRAVQAVKVAGHALLAAMNPVSLAVVGIVVAIVTFFMFVLSIASVIGSSQDCDDGNCTSASGGLQADGIVAFAVEATKNTRPSDCRNTNNSLLMAAEAQARKNTEAAGGHLMRDARGLMCDCGMFVSIVLRGTGFDPMFPEAGTSIQKDYMMSHPEKYERYTNFNEHRPGDIMVTTEIGHIFIMLDGQGGVAGKVAEASMDSHDALVQGSSYYAYNGGEYCAQDNYLGGRKYFCFHPITKK